MRRRAWIAMLGSVAGLLLSDTARPAHAQGPLNLWYQLAERVDEKRLQHDQARLQNDINNGNAARVNRDLEQIRRDEWWLMADRIGPRFGPPFLPSRPIPPSGVLVPHPRYPGYGYDPSNPAQLYPLAQPAPVPTPGGELPPQPAPGSTPGLTPPTRVSVVILNPRQTGVAVNYVVDGAPYRTGNGDVQELVVDPSSVIVYDRGGAFGVQRYRLSAGVYEFRSSDAGWALVKLRPTPEVPGSDTENPESLPEALPLAPGGPTDDSRLGRTHHRESVPSAEARSEVP